MICPKCNSEASDAAPFCPECGGKRNRPILSAGQSQFKGDAFGGIVLQR